MSDTVTCPRCSARGAEIPLPVTITPTADGKAVHIESYRPCPECGCTVSYDQVLPTTETPVEEALLGYELEWHEYDGETSFHNSEYYKPDEYDKALARLEKLDKNPDIVAYLWPIESGADE